MTLEETKAAITSQIQNNLVNSLISDLAAAKLEIARLTASASETKSDTSTSAHTERKLPTAKTN